MRQQAPRHWDRVHFEPAIGLPQGERRAARINTMLLRGRTPAPSPRGPRRVRLLCCPALVVSSQRSMAASRRSSLFHVSAIKTHLRGLLAGPEPATLAPSTLDSTHALDLIARVPDRWRCSGEARPWVTKGGLPARRPRRADGCLSAASQGNQETALSPFGTPLAPPRRPVKAIGACKTARACNTTQMSHTS